MRTLRIVIACAVMIGTAALTAKAGEIGHFSPGGAGIRDYAMGEPGLVGVIYNVSYSTNRIHDRDGNQIRSVDIGGTRIDVDAKLDVFSTSPMLIWISHWQLLGAKVGAYAAPTLANTSLGAAFSTSMGLGRSIDAERFDLADLLVQPFWLGWGRPHFDATMAYAAWVPIGRYETETVDVPSVGPRRVEAHDNIGYGFWTQQVQGSITAYPWKHRKTAVAATTTWEIHGNKKDFDLTPGQNLSFSWGVSQMFTAGTESRFLWDVGPTGYSSWQVTDDRGGDAPNPEVHDRVHGIGGQLGLTYLPWKSVFYLRYLQEFGAVDRFQGSVVALDYAVRF